MPTPIVRRLRAARAALPLMAALAAAPAYAQQPLPLDLFRYDRAAPLDLQSRPLETREGVDVQAISYASPKGGRVTGRLFVPQGNGPFAGVVLAHGAPGNSEAFTGRGIYIARHGAVVIAIDAPFNRREGGPLTLTPRDSVEQVQLIVDLQRAVDVLLSRPDVDSARLAYVGRSYGGATGALFAGVERRLTTYILASADGGITTRFTEPDAPPPPPGREEQARAWLASMQPIEGLRFVGNANGTLFFQNGRQDPVVTPARAEALHAAAAGVRTEVRWYDAAHALNPAAYVDQLRWLSDKVGTRAPGPEDEAGPEIPPPPAQAGPQPRPRP
ncbi:alpha/beta hydrolase family protein [Longimicrobium sp.]|uniref:alpha/beta hydrolase family protein n=1 Tax=Longimicrobium sp. TaxID=2029185 RepID=UPI002E35DB72|nr:alpha/beta fold hydrolase [Longimicrobium sp.]HEX6036864.1 alpha/beta fold hydrolase [Longimicrobium sp.]